MKPRDTTEQLKPMRARANHVSRAASRATVKRTAQFLSRLRELYGRLLLTLIRPALETDRRERAISLDSGVRIVHREIAPKERERLLSLFSTNRQGRSKDVKRTGFQDGL